MILASWPIGPWNIRRSIISIIIVIQIIIAITTLESSAHIHAEDRLLHVPLVTNIWQADCQWIDFFTVVVVSVSIDTTTTSPSSPWCFCCWLLRVKLNRYCYYQEWQRRWRRPRQGGCYHRYLFHNCRDVLWKERSPLVGFSDDTIRPRRRRGQWPRPMRMITS